MADVLVAYLAASVVATIVFSEVGGRPEGPLATFPAYLLLAPFMPFLLILDFFDTRSILDVASAGIFCVCFVACVAYARWRQRSRPPIDEVQSSAGSDLG